MYIIVNLSQIVLMSFVHKTKYVSYVCYCLFFFIKQLMQCAGLISSNNGEESGGVTLLY